MTVREIIVPTGEIIERDMTEDEIQQREIDLQMEQAREAALAQKATQRFEILERLGLTEDEAKLILS